MSSARPLDNINPTIVVPTTTAAGPSAQFTKASQKTRLERLWRDDAGAEDEDEFTVLGDAEEREEIDEQEVFGTSLSSLNSLACADAIRPADLLRSITDPEHPLTLEQLAVVSAPQIKVSNKPGHERVLIEFTPTIPHCSMATLIGESSSQWVTGWRADKAQA